VGGLTGLAATDGIVQVRVPGKLADKTVDPSEDDLPASYVANSLDPQPQGLDLGQQRRRAEVDEMARQVEGKPAIAEGTGLQARGIGHGHDKRPAGGEERRRMTQRPGGLAEVLKRMPEDDRRPVPVHLFDLGVADMGSGCVRLKTHGFTAAVHEGLNEGPVAGSHIENRARRQNPVQTNGER
jgi:hypothetical protein